MKLGRVLAAAALAAIAIGGAVALTADDEVVEPAPRPGRVLDVADDEVVSVDVIDPESGAMVTLTPSGDGFAADPPGDVSSDKLTALRMNLFPLLAIRTFTSTEPEYGLDNPTVELVVHTTTGRHEVTIGSANFDDTGYYASADEVGLIITSIVQTLLEITITTP